MKSPSTAFKPGQSGNPNGRPPKGYSITEMMKEMLNGDLELKKKIGSVIAEKALQGDITAIKTLWNYMDGMPPQEMELHGKDGQPLISFPGNFIGGLNQTPTETTGSNTNTIKSKD